MHMQPTAPTKKKKIVQWGYSLATKQQRGHSMRIESAAISRIFLKFGVCVKEHHPIWSFKRFFLYLFKQLWNFECEWNDPKNTPSFACILIVLRISLQLA
jgi:hypothetical protein